MRARSTFLVALALVLAGALAGCGDDDTPDAATDPPATAEATESPSAEPSEDASEPAEAPANLISVTVAGDEITPAPGKVKVPVNEEVTIEVTSDVEEEVHVHGYDKSLDLEPGDKASVTFTADIPGLFEVELEESGTLLFELQVS